MNFPSGLTLEYQRVCEHVPISPNPSTSGCPETLKPLISIDAIHDGAYIPKTFASSSSLELEELERVFINERDWGAELVAKHLASALHLPSYFRVNTARALLDFGRFPGVSQKADSHMDRMAINHPFAEALNHEQKRAVLLEHYDEISRQLENAFDGQTQDRDSHLRQTKSVGLKTTRGQYHHTTLWSSASRGKPHPCFRSTLSL